MPVSGRQHYRKWLRSEEWFLMRARCLSQQLWVCQSCGKVDYGNDVHHIWYRGRWKDTHHYRDLRVLCRPCHKAVHTFTSPWRYKSEKEGAKAYRDAIFVLRTENNSWQIIKEKKQQEKLNRFGPGKPKKKQFANKIERRNFYLQKYAHTERVQNYLQDQKARQDEIIAILSG